MNALHATLRAASPRALATLIRLLRDFDSAEDATQEAVTRALEVWPHEGIPDNPVAWLVTTGRNKAIDLHRRRTLETQRLASLSFEEHNSFRNDAAAMTPSLHFQDDLLRLIFTCCHPVLAPEEQVALTLKTVAGLTVQEIAHAFLVTAKTMEQRLTRAKRRVREAYILYEVPSVTQLPARLESVMAVIYLLFNEGYSASGESGLIRAELCSEAIRLARMLSRLFRHEAEVTGLLALLLLQHARYRARLDKAGNIIPLDEQQRTLWDQRLIAEGHVLVEKALRQKHPGRYQIQAAIAALHNEAASAEDTDWAQIAELYGVLERYQPSPVVTLNRAVAVAQAQSAKAGIALLQTIEWNPEMQDYHYFHAALGALLVKEGEIATAVTAYKKALSLTRNPSEKRFLRNKLTALAGK